MKIYLAARFDRGHELKRYRDELAEVGIEVVSRWLDNHGVADERSETQNGGMVYTDDTLSRFAVEDLEDIYKADILITFTEKRSIGYTSGGRHVELGYALGHEKPVIVVGPTENIFHRMGVTALTDITVVPDWHMALAHLLGRSVRNLEAVVPA